MSTIKVDTYLTRGGASEIAIDKLKGASSAGSMIVVGESGSTTTNLQQGLAKAWANFNGSGTVNIDDSFNIGSITDNQTGDYTFAYSNAFSSGNHSTPMGVGQTTIGARRDAAESASTVKVSCMNSSFGLADEPSAYFTCHGDLA